MGELGTPCDNLPSLTTSAGQTTGHVQPAVCSQQLHHRLPPDHQSHNQTPANHRENSLSVTITNILSTFFFPSSIPPSLLPFFLLAEVQPTYGPYNSNTTTTTTTTNNNNNNNNDNNDNSAKFAIGSECTTRGYQVTVQCASPGRGGELAGAGNVCA